MYYSITFNDVASDAVADQFMTAVALIVADTAGHRMRVLEIDIGPSTDTPGDRNISVRLQRIADVSAGTAGTAVGSVTGANMPKKDPASVDSIVTGKTDYTTEPTVYETETLWQEDFNARSGLLKRWEPQEAFMFTRDSLCGLLVAPRTANAENLSGSIGFEVY